MWLVWHDDGRGAFPPWTLPSSERPRSHASWPQSARRRLSLVGAGKIRTEVRRSRRLRFSSLERGAQRRQDNGTECRACAHAVRAAGDLALVIRRRSHGIERLVAGPGRTRCGCVWGQAGEERESSAIGCRETEGSRAGSDVKWLLIDRPPVRCPPVLARTRPTLRPLSPSPGVSPLGPAFSPVLARCFFTPSSSPTTFLPALADPTPCLAHALPRLFTASTRRTRVSSGSTAATAAQPLSLTPLPHRSRPPQTPHPSGCSRVPAQSKTATMAAGVRARGLCGGRAAVRAVAPGTRPISYTLAQSPCAPA